MRTNSAASHITETRKPTTILMAVNNLSHSPPLTARKKRKPFLLVATSIATTTFVFSLRCEALQLTLRNAATRARSDAGSLRFFQSLLRHEKTTSLFMTATNITANSDNSSLDGKPSSMVSPSSSAISNKSKLKNVFDSFDYTAHWYPVCWARDVPLNQPIRVTLFDVDYVLARVKQEKSNDDESNGKNKKEQKQDDETNVFFALIDSCPHKKVALSEGRITDCGSSSKKYIQCSYHGWAFDGKDGRCVEIPQNAIANNAHYSPLLSSSTNDPLAKMLAPTKRRQDATSVAVTEFQGMIWMQPFLTPLEAVAATEKGTILAPPRIPEIDLPGYRISTVVRDFPIDWTVLLENIMDPDHGFFAHSSSFTSSGFDLYAADGVENMMEIEEEALNAIKSPDKSIDGTGVGWKITSQVNAVEKMKKHNREVRLGVASKLSGKQVSEFSKEELPTMKATTTFIAPSLVTMGRRDAGSNSSYLTGFWVCPVGVSRSRFMSAVISKAPITIPRWYAHININNFLDQDTFLLLGQNRAVLKKEAEESVQADKTLSTARPINVRKSMYVYRSPSELLPVRLGQFFDATLSRVPNRREGLLAWVNYDNSYSKHPIRGNTDTKSNISSLLFKPWPSRRQVLDRYEQSTKICPDSMGAVANCEKAMRYSKLIAFGIIFMRMISNSSSALHGVATATTNHSPSRLFSSIVSLAGSAVRFITEGKMFYGLIATASLSHWIASRVRREFFFKFDEELHLKDVKSIPNNWMDL